MRRAVWVPLLLLACSGDGPDPEPPKQVPLPGPSIEWTSVTVSAGRLRGFTIDYPKGWKVEKIPNGWGLQFINTESKGFRPNFHVYWGTQPRKVENWAREAENKYLQRGPGASVAIERKKTAVAGMPARLLIHTRDDKVGPITWLSGDRFTGPMIRSLGT